MTAVRLIHWHAESAAARARQLESEGFTVEYSALANSSDMRGLAEHLPGVFVIDLERSPSHGREAGLWLRRRKATRRVPLVFAGGAPAKVDRVRRLLPDAIYCCRGQVGSAIGAALALTLSDPVVPDSGMAGYSGTRLPKKLGIKAGSVVALIDSPPGFAKTLGPLPAGAKVVRRPAANVDLTIWFCRAQADLDAKVALVRQRLEPGGRLWICLAQEIFRSCVGPQAGRRARGRVGLRAGGL